MPILNIKVEINENVDSSTYDPQTLADELIFDRGDTVTDILEAEWEDDD